MSMNKMICYNKNSLPLENSGPLEGFSHLKYATNATSPKLVVAKQVTFKSISQDLVLQNYLESLSGVEQKAQESYLTILATNIVKSWLIFS